MSADTRIRNCRLPSLVGGTILVLAGTGHAVAHDAIAPTASIPIGSVASIINPGKITVEIPEVSFPEDVKREQGIHRPPVVRVGPAEIGRTITVLPGTYVELVFPADSGLINAVSDTPDILKPSPGPFVSPFGVLGLFQAIGHGTGTINVIQTSTANGAGSPPAPPPATHTPPIITSNNWTGYILQSNNDQPFIGVSATWIVPFAYHDKLGASSTWIGIDGFTTDTVLQLGTEQDYNSANPLDAPNAFAGNSTYYAWIETWGEGLRPLQRPIVSGMALAKVSPGDVISASIAPAPGVTPKPGQHSLWVLTMTDHDATHGWTNTQTIDYVGGLGSAEWVEEATSVSDPLPIAHFSDVTFNRTRVQMGNESSPSAPSFNVSQARILVQQNNKAAFYAIPSFPSCSRDSFTIRYHYDFVGSYGNPPTVQGNDDGPSISTTFLPIAVLNQPYSGTLQSVAAHSPSWSVTAGPLPPGIALASDGLLSGSPTALGRHKFTVSVADVSTGALSCPQALILDVEPQMPPADFSLNTTGIQGWIQLSASKNHPAHAVGSIQITAAGTYGFNSPIALSLKPQANATGSMPNATFTPATLIPGEFSTLRVEYPQGPLVATSVTVMGGAGPEYHTLTVAVSPPSSNLPSGPGGSGSLELQQ